MSEFEGDNPSSLFRDTIKDAKSKLEMDSERSSEITAFRKRVLDCDSPLLKWKKATDNFIEVLDRSANLWVGSEIWKAGTQVIAHNPLKVHFVI